MELLYLWLAFVREVYLCYDRIFSGFIGILPDRPMIIPIKVRLIVWCTWSGVIQNGSATVARIIAGQIRDKGGLKAHCLKRPTDAISLLGSSELFCLFTSCFLCFCSVFSSAPVGSWHNSDSCRPRSWSTGPPLLCLRGTLARMPQLLLSYVSRRRRR